MSLRDLIGAADYLNHAIPNPEEIEGAIDRLSAAGLLSVQDERFSLSDAGRELWNGQYKKGEAYLKAWKRVEQRLATAEFPELDILPYRLDAGRFEKAFREYRVEFWKAAENTHPKNKKSP